MLKQKPLGIFCAFSQETQLSDITPFNEETPVQMATLKIIIK